VSVKITLPLLLPFIVSALRIAYGVAWKIALVSELFGTGTGIGYLMGEAQQSAKPALLYACCFAIVLIFFAGEKLILDPLSRRVPLARRRGGKKRGEPRPPARPRHVPGTPGLVLDEAGAGELVLFMHGIGGNRTNWTQQVQRFGEHFLAVAWDARGYNGSEDY